jgi:hypothetical protein
MDAYHTENAHQCYVWAREHARDDWFNHGVLAVDDKYFFVRDDKPGEFNSVFTCLEEGVELEPSMLPDPAVEASRKEAPRIATGAQHNDWIDMPNHQGKVRDITRTKDGIRRALIHVDFAGPGTQEVAYAETYVTYDCAQASMQQNLETTVFNSDGKIFSHQREEFNGSRWAGADPGTSAAQQWEFICGAPARLVTK